MDKKPEGGRSAFLYGITAVILLQCLTFVCVNLWQNWRLDSLKLKIAQKGELLSVLETGCDISLGQYHLNPGTTRIRTRRQGPTLTDFMRDFLSVQQKALETVCARRHDLCIPGVKGLIGDQGSTGPRGSAGLAGLQGQKGDQGPVGLPGVKGDTGPKGVNGTTGVIGGAGTRGIKGAKGATGNVGSRGDPGIRGNNGTAGATGDRGDRGTKGGPGPKGAVGLPGVKGAVGLAGIPGPKGVTGIRGHDGKLLHGECLCLNDFSMIGNFSSVVNVPYGAPFALHCQFNKMNIPATWSKDGGPISHRGNATGNDLVFEQVLKSDGGTYHCSGPDGILGYVSKQVTVVVGPSSVYDCDFESTCSWTDATDDKMDWSNQIGRTPTALTGPTHDHTFVSAPGHYIYLETSKGLKGDNSALQSNPLSAHHRFCLTFWYHMYGATVGTLEVRLKQPGRLGSPMWSRTGNQGNVWTMAKVDLPPQTNSYYVVLNAIRGSSYTGDIAIDDIIFLDGPCP